MWLLVLLLFGNAILGCDWPTADVLFVIDSTLNVGVFNFELVKKFLIAVIDDMQVSGMETRVGLAKFTPKISFEFSLISGINKEELKRRIHMVSYAPCVEGEENCLPLATINSIAKAGLSTTSGNRALVPDVMIVISSTAYKIPELGVGETLIKPMSPIFIFSISVGELDQITSSASKYASSATTIKFSALNYDALQKLASPLCIAADDFIKGDDKIANSASFGGSVAVVVITVTVVIFIIVLLLLCYALYRYHNENSNLKTHIAMLESRQYMTDGDSHNMKTEALKEMEEEKNNVAGQIDEMQRNDKYTVLKPYDRRTSEVVPITWTPTINGSHLEHLSTEVQPKNSLNESVNNRNAASSIMTATATESKHTEMTLSGTERTNATESNKNAPQRSANERQVGKIYNGHTSVDGDSSKSEDPNALHTDGEMEATGEGSDGDDASEIDSAQGFLPSNHPANTLPPIDLLLLVDSSGSIGLSNFEKMKKYINAFLNNVDISPGRSRIAAIIFATEPKVSFGFDKYYTHRSTQRSVRKLPYLGGPTFLSKALVFASGILYQEQNMKDGKHRMHKLMPTPKHDRLQVMIVVSDGYSEDNFDNAAAILHEKLHVKIAAMVGRIYNKERLLPITRFEGAIFMKEQTEALSIWLWRQQRIWYENFGSYVEKEKSLPLNRRRLSTNSSPTKKEN